MSWEFVKLKKVLKQYRITHIVDNERVYKQVTISKHDGVKFRGTKKGKDIGRKRQFIIDLNKYPNTLMLVRQGVYEGAIGIAPPEVDQCIATENMPMFSIEGISIDYLNLIIQSPYFKEELEKIPTTGSAQKSIHERQILEIEIPFPSQEEQELIVDSFKSNQDGLNEISTELTHQLDLVKQLRQAFLREAMQGKLVPQDQNDEPASVLLEKIKAEKERLIKDPPAGRAGKTIKKQKPLPPITEDEIPFEIPESWVWCRLGELTKYGTSPKAEPSDLKPNTWVLDLEDIEKETSKLLCKVRFEERNSLSTKSKFEVGDVLYSKLRPYLDKVIVADESGVCTTEILPLKTYAGMNSEFFRFSLKRSDFLSYVNSVTKGMKMPRLGTKEGELAIMPLPPLCEQQRIVTKLNELMAFCDELEASIKESQHQNELLLQQVIREALEPKEKEVERV